MAPNSTGDRDTAPRLSWSPPQVPQHTGNDDDVSNVDQSGSTYINDRFQPHRTIYPDTPEMEDASRGQPPRKRRHVETSDVDSLNQDEQSSKGPYFDAIRNTFTSSQNPAVSLSQETLRALDSRPGESSGRLQGWLQGPTQFSVVDVQRRKKHSVEYLLQEGEVQPSAPMPTVAQRQNEQHECVNCKRSFNTKSELRHHARRYEKRPYNCDQCDKSFLYPKDLRRHATTHTGSKQYRCLSCPKAFSRKDNLRRHMSNEHGNEEGPYEEVVNPSSGRRDREPDEDSEDRFDNQTQQQQNSGVAYGTRQNGAPQSGSDGRSGSNSGQQHIQQGSNIDEGRNQEHGRLTTAQQDAKVTSSLISLTDRSAISHATSDSESFDKSSQPLVQIERWRKERMSQNQRGSEIAQGLETCRVEVEAL